MSTKSRLMYFSPNTEVDFRDKNDKDRTFIVESIAIDINAFQTSIIYTGKNTHTSETVNVDGDTFRELN